MLDAYAQTTSTMAGQGSSDGEEEPILNARRFIELVQVEKKPLYEGSQISFLKAVARLTNLKCEFNLLHRVVDGIALLMKEMCPNDNEMASNFYETKRLLAGLELQIVKSMYLRVACYCGKMMNNWMYVQFVVPRGTLGRL